MEPILVDGMTILHQARQPDRAERMEGMKKYQIIYMKNGCAVTKWARTIEQVDKAVEKLISAGYALSVWPNPHQMRAGW